ncbi:MAG: alanine racemase, partial [Bacteroidota bacterium]
MRLKLEQGTNNCQVLDDTYDNDLIGLEKVLEFMAQQKQALNKTVILTDLLYHGSDPKDLYCQVAHLLQDKGINRVIGIGKQLTDYAAIFQPLNAHFYSNVEALLNSKLLYSFQEEVVLVKGARDSGLEKITSQLQQKVHSTVLEVDLDAISYNLSFFQSKLNRKTKMMVIVKALAYGSSSFEIAHLLQHYGVDYIAVAYADEGIALREKGITLPIMVMNPTPASFPRLLSYQLEPALYSLKLHLTPPAMSHKLRRIRELVGDEVLVRAGRGMV